MSDTVNRREFARLVGIGALSGGLTGTPASARGDEPQSPPAPQEVAPEEHLLAVVKQMYPHENLTPEVCASIENELRGQIARGKLLRNFSLENGETPFVFRAYRKINPNDK